MKRRTFIQSTIGAAVGASLSGKLAVAAANDAQSSALRAIDAVQGNGGKVTLQGSALQELRDALNGRLLLPQNEGYEEARHILSPAFDKHPALIVQVTGAADVQSAVDFARENSLLVAVKCGGHSFSGQSTCDGGMMIDLSRMRNVRVDTAAKRAWVAGGTLIGLLDHETMSQGLVTPMGSVFDTGIGGLTTGGGFGRVARRFGLSLDNVRSVDVVGADGKLRHADEKENADLFWGVRGGGGNFGVVTSFEFELHPMQRRVIAGVVTFPISMAREVLTFHADYSVAAPDELCLDCNLSQQPGSAEGLIAVQVCYSGDERKADKVLEPLRRFKGALSDTVKSLDYIVVQGSNTQIDTRSNQVAAMVGGYYFKSGLIAGINAGLIDAIVENMKAHPKLSSFIGFQHAGGAIGRISSSATAFAQRYATHNLLTSLAWETGDDAAEHMRYARQRWKEFEKHTRGFYTNDMAGDEVSSTMNANYGANYPRLVQIKNKYDPSNLFRLNANVKPA